MQENLNKFKHIKERIMYFVENQNIKKYEFFEKIGMSHANFSSKALNTPINSNAILNILKLFSTLNLYWLITGEGEMIVGETIPTDKEKIKEYEETISMLKDSINTKNELIEALKEQIKQLEHE